MKKLLLALLFVPLVYCSSEDETIEVVIEVVGNEIYLV